MEFQIRRSAMPALRQYLIVVMTFFFFFYLCEYVSFYLYPLALFFIGSRVYALTILGHEAVHGLIFKSQTANRIFARYFCYFPSLVSYSHYSQLHFMHHRFAKTERDPDVPSYTLSWNSKSHWLRQQFADFLNGKTFYYFLQYFAGFPQCLKKNYAFKRNSDHFQMFVFWLVVGSALTYFHVWSYFWLYWFLPFYLWLPWIQLVGVFQHFGEEKMNEQRSRSFTLYPSFLNPLFFPLNIHFHQAHHADPRIPYFQLPLASDLSNHEIATTAELGQFVFAEANPKDKSA